MAEHDNSTDSSKAPSFNGRLQLKDFMFTTPQAGTTEGKNQGSPLRCSSRISTGGSSPAPVSTSRNQPGRGTTPSPIKKSRSSISSSSNPTAAADNNSITKRKPSKRSTYFDQPSPPKKRSSTKSGYAPPATYAHLPLLPDAITPNLLILFIGLNPGLSTSASGHAYAHPSNLFYKLLHSSGITPILIPPVEDRTLPKRFSLGFTNIVGRPTRNGGELKNGELDAGVARLEAKVRRWRPEAVCLVGKGIWESLFRVRQGGKEKKKKKKQGKGEFRYGWQEERENMGVIPAEGGLGADEVREDEEYEAELMAGEEERDEEDVKMRRRRQEEEEEKQKPWGGARVFVATSTSGLAATLRPEEKERIWKELGDWCVARRGERGDPVES